ncbi:MAG: hypothetical protein R6X22_07500 [Gemmatimonadota bacterium]
MRSPGAWRHAPGLALLVLASIGLLPSRASGQACSSEAGRYRLIVQPRLVVFPVPGIAEFETGWVLADPMSIRVIPRGGGSRGWELCVRSDDPDLGGYGKPISDLEWRLAGQAAWQPISAWNQPVASGFANEIVSVELRARLDWERDAPDTYSAVITFTSAKL